MTQEFNHGNTLLLPAGQPEALRQAADSLRAGGLVAFPTDTVYGLGALVWNEASIAQIYAAKERPPEKAIPILWRIFKRPTACLEASLSRWKSSLAFSGPAR